MRMWSLHPKYLDAKGLVALWRESLLAKNVLLGNTKGYKNHPQLIRFKNTQNPISAINYYLSEIFKESIKRNYRFDKSKIDWNFAHHKIEVTNEQILFEWKHLMQKLEKRDTKLFCELNRTITIEPNPIFIITSGKIESWERL